MRKFASESPRGGDTVDDFKKFTPLVEEEERESDFVPVNEIPAPATVETEGDESEDEIYTSEVADDVRQAQKKLEAKRETTAELGQLLKLKQEVEAKTGKVRETTGSRKSVLAEMGAYELDKSRRSGHRGTHKPPHKDVRQSIYI